MINSSHQDDNSTKCPFEGYKSVFQMHTQALSSENQVLSHVCHQHTNALSMLSHITFLHDETLPVRPELLSA